MERKQGMRGEGQRGGPEHKKLPVVKTLKVRDGTDGPDTSPPPLAPRGEKAFPRWLEGESESLFL